MECFKILEKGALNFTEPQFCLWYMNCPTKIFDPPNPPIDPPTNGGNK
ncbi:TPA: hypothetical protein PTV43_000624 [Clostridium botulinum]|nr:hypothetical protein [Clostridium botulinum]